MENGRQMTHGRLILMIYYYYITLSDGLIFIRYDKVSRENIFRCSQSTVDKLFLIIIIINDDNAFEGRFKLPTATFR